MNLIATNSKELKLAVLFLVTVIHGHTQLARLDSAALPGRLDPLVPGGRAARRIWPGAAPALALASVPAPAAQVPVPVVPRLAGAEARQRPLCGTRSAADRSRWPVA